MPLVSFFSMLPTLCFLASSGGLFLNDKVIQGFLGMSQKETRFAAKDNGDGGHSGHRKDDGDCEHSGNCKDNGHC